MAPHTSIGKIRQGISFTCPTWYPWCPGNQVGTQVGQGQVWICHLYQITSEMATLSWTWFNWPIKLQVSYNPSLIHYDLVAVNLDSTMLEVHSWWNWLRWVLNGGGCISRSNADRNWLTNFALDGEVWPSWDPIHTIPTSWAASSLLLLIAEIFLLFGVAGRVQSLRGSFFSEIFQIGLRLLIKCVQLCRALQHSPTSGYILIVRCSFFFGILSSVLRAYPRPKTCYRHFFR